MDSRYDQQPIGDGRTRFTVIPARAPRSVAVGAFAPAGAVTALAVTVFAPGFARMGAILFALAAAAIGAYGYLSRRRRVDADRAPGGTFVVSSAGIEAAGAWIPRDVLRQLVVTNAVPGASAPMAVAPGAPYAGRRPVPLLSRPAGLAAVSYLLCAVQSERSTTLAGGMTAETADGLLVDVCRILSVGAD